MFALFLSISKASAFQQIMHKMHLNKIVHEWFMLLGIIKKLPHGTYLLDKSITQTLWVENVQEFSLKGFKGERFLQDQGSWHIASEVMTLDIV